MKATVETEPRLLFYLQQAIQDASLTPSGDRRVSSRRMLYLEMDAAGSAQHLHDARSLDSRPLGHKEPGVAFLDEDTHRVHVLRLPFSTSGPGTCPSTPIPNAWRPFSIISA